MKIYVASSWRNTLQPGVVNLLRDLGHEVYDFKNPPKKSSFSWSEIDPNWQEWTPEEYLMALDHPRAIEGFNSDFDAMKWAECCVMVLPCGRSANTEAGWMKGAGKSVYVYQEMSQEPELMYKIYDGIITHELQLASVFQELNTDQYKRVCSGCGCTDMDCSGCIERTGKPCYWVNPSLCSACD
jgi:hypothetical protein